MYRVYIEYRIYLPMHRKWVDSSRMLDVPGHVPTFRNARMPRPTEIKVMHFKSVAMCLGLNGCSVKGDNWKQWDSKGFRSFHGWFFRPGCFRVWLEFCLWRNWSKNFSDFETNNSLTCDLFVDFQVYRRGKFEFRCSIFRSEWRFGAKRTRCSLSLVLDLFEMMCSS